MAGASKVLCTVGGIPGVSAGGPGQRVSERVKEKVEAPYQDHDIVGVTEEHDHH